MQVICSLVFFFFGWNVTDARVDRPPTRAAGETAAARLDALAWADFDGDGRVDVLQLGSEGAARLLRNGAGGAFEDVSAATGLDLGAGVLDAQWGDVDGDARPDLLLVRPSGKSELWMNCGYGAFSDRTADALPPGEDVFAANIRDVDGDGRSELVQWTAQGPRLYVNENGRFTHSSWPEWDRDSRRDENVSTSPPGVVVRPGTPGPPVDASTMCAAGVVDLATGTCLGASSTPTLGALYPLGPELSIDALGRVGIGTITPGARLEVQGDGADAARFEDGRVTFAQGSELAFEDPFLNQRSGITTFGTEDLFVGSDNWNAVHFGPGGNLTATPVGNVGVGTQSPTVRFEVVGNGADAARFEQGGVTLGQSANLRAEDANMNQRLAITTFGTQDLYVGFDTWDSVHFGPNGNLTADPVGNVGIGTSSPSAPLGVVGNGADAARFEQGRVALGPGSQLVAEDSSQNQRLAMTTFGTEELYFGFDMWDGVHLGPTGNLFADPIGNVGIGTWNPTAALEVHGNGADAVRIEQGSVTLAQGSELRAEDTSLNQRLAITTFGTPELYFGFDSWDGVHFGPVGNLFAAPTGNVGIGTGDPTAALDVQGNGFEAARFQQGGVTLVQSSDLGVENVNQNRRVAVTTFGTEELYVGPDSFDAVYFGPSSNLMADPVGNVGIGTYAPTARLSVDGNGAHSARFDQGNVTLGPSSSLALEDSTQYERVAMTTYGTTELYVGSGSWDSATFGPSSNLTADPVGNVGIGTPYPTARLEVHGNGADALRVAQGSLTLGQSSELVAEDVNQIPRLVATTFGSDELFIGSDAWSAVSFGPNGNLVADPFGNVGIGVTSPGNILTVQQGSATDPVADAWTTYSSRRWKTDIETIEDPLDTVEGLRGVTYRWKESGKPDVGFIAEEVGEVLPEVVQYEENGVDARSVDYARITAVLVEAVKAQQLQIEELSRELERLKAATLPE